MISPQKDSKSRPEGGLRIKGLFNKKTEPGRPLISIITICLICKKETEQTIKSVIEQTYNNIEYIIIDGGSTDGTLNMIHNYEDKIAYWISERDEGISDAFNKGISHSTGDYINFLNSGDCFSSRDVIKRVSKVLAAESPWIAYGRVAIMSVKGDKISYVVGAPFRHRDFKWKMGANHQGFFIGRQYIDKYGIFDRKFSMAMDYDHLLRGIHKVKVVFLDFTVANFIEGGSSDNYKRFIERFYVHKKHGISPMWYSYLLFIFYSIRWMIRKILDHLHLRWVVSIYGKIVYRRC